MPYINFYTVGGNDTIKTKFLMKYPVAHYPETNSFIYFCSKLIDLNSSLSLNKNCQFVMKSVEKMWNKSLIFTSRGLQHIFRGMATRDKQSTIVKTHMIKFKDGTL